ncbi:hypothetical protein VP01_3131g1 [Puccinia sorghi]|uniref:No apical meristem-associated C-terminal domain-containing protein n=1 Tax=Puccinia sorghi TaxID=27349 RepID=A0A0L6UZ16_9BASI|nr:hypothetical protein VP01_3131g1 [Puccinia sorghi]
MQTVFKSNNIPPNHPTGVSMKIKRSAPAGSKRLKMRSLGTLRQKENFGIKSTQCTRMLVKTDTGKSFNLDHCWVPHHSTKWIKQVEEASGWTQMKPKKDDGNIKEDPTSVLSRESGNLSRCPEGSKAVKKRKEKKKTRISKLPILSRIKRNFLNYLVRSKILFMHLQMK